MTATTEVPGRVNVGPADRVFVMGALELPIPDGASTESKQDDTNNKLDTIISNQTNAIVQDIITSDLNFTVTNLDYNEEFVGIGESIQNATAIQIFHSADEDCIVYLDQSVDQTFSDSANIFTSHFETFANVAAARSFTSVAPYYRLRVKNVDPSLSTTTHIGTYTGKTPILSILPTELSPQGNLQVVASIRGDENYDRHAWINPTGELVSSPIYRLVGAVFDNDTLDTNFWTASLLRNATITQSGGEVEVNTGTTANGYAKLTSVRKARFVAGSAMLFSAGVAFATAGTTDNVRRVGAYITSGDTSDNVVDGYFFQLDGTTFSVGYRAGGGTIVLIDSGNFNGNLGPHFVPPSGENYVNLRIEYSPLGAFWYIGNSLLHKVTAAHKSHTETLPITIENENTNSITTEVKLDCVGAYIARQGQLETSPTSKLLTTEATTILKRGAGTIKGIIIGAVANTCDVRIYDGLSTGGTLIWSTGAMSAKTDFTDINFYGTPFSNGLTIDIFDAAGSVLVVYE